MEPSTISANTAAWVDALAVARDRRRAQRDRLVFGRDQVLLWRHRRFAAGARWITIAAPPEVTAGVRRGAVDHHAPESSRPSVWRRRVYGTPHVGWEYTWTGRTLTIRLWVPGTVPPGSVEAAVRAAWPACTVVTGDERRPDSRRRR